MVAPDLTEGEKRLLAIRSQAYPMGLLVVHPVEAATAPTHHSLQRGRLFSLSPSCS